MRTAGRKTRFQGVYVLGNGKYRLRIYFKEPLTGKERDRVVEAASVENALDQKRALPRLS